MLPIAIINNPAPVPIVNTTLPGTVITHVPYDNVAPPISNAQVNNNASPNSEAAAAEDQSDATQLESADEEQAATAANNAAQAQAPNAQATFLAQLLSQDGSPATQTILVQYEKLVALGNVKYKPSNALKPVPAPESTFGKLLQQNRPAAVVQPTAPSQPVSRQPMSTPADTEEAAFSNPTVEAPPPRQQQRNATFSTIINTAENQTNTPQLISAYTSTAARVDNQNTEITTELA